MARCPCETGPKTRSAALGLRVSSGELEHLKQEASAAGYEDNTSAWARDKLLSAAHSRQDPFLALLQLFSVEELMTIRHAAAVHGKDPIEYVRLILLWWSEEPKCSQLSGVDEKSDDSLSMTLNGSLAHSKSESLASMTVNLIDVIGVLLNSSRRK